MADRTPHSALLHYLGPSLPLLLVSEAIGIRSFPPLPVPGASYRPQRMITSRSESWGKVWTSPLAKVITNLHR